MYHLNGNILESADVRCCSRVASFVHVNQPFSGKSATRLLTGIGRVVTGGVQASQFELSDRLGNSYVILKIHPNDFLKIELQQLKHYLSEEVDTSRCFAITRVLKKK